MISIVEFKNKTWNITHEETGVSVTAEQVIGDFKTVHKGCLRGRVLVAFGVPQESIHHLPQAAIRHLGITTPMSSITAKAPMSGTRRFRLLPGGVVEPYAV